MKLKGDYSLDGKLAIGYNNGNIEGVGKISLCKKYMRLFFMPPSRENMSFSFHVEVEIDSHKYFNYENFVWFDSRYTEPKQGKLLFITDIMPEFRDTVSVNLATYIGTDGYGSHSGSYQVHLKHDDIYLQYTKNPKYWAYIN